MVLVPAIAQLLEPLFLLGASGAFGATEPVFAKYNESSVAGAKAATDAFSYTVPLGIIGSNESCTLVYNLLKSS